MSSYGSLLMLQDRMRALMSMSAGCLLDVYRKGEDGLAVGADVRLTCSIPIRRVEIDERMKESLQKQIRA